MATDGPEDRPAGTAGTSRTASSWGSHSGGASHVLFAHVLEGTASGGSGSFRPEPKLGPGNEKPPGPEGAGGSASTYVVPAHKRRRMVTTRVIGAMVAAVTVMVASSVL